MHFPFGPGELLGRPASVVARRFLLGLIRDIMEIIEDNRLKAPSRGNGKNLKLLLDESYSRSWTKMGIVRRRKLEEELRRAFLVAGWRSLRIQQREKTGLSVIISC